ncbi:uncharacterized protein LOC115830899 [Nomascus leucogenys]|uniref:uncharacterized protein LOC115830899 n=1 Tax=Nomascus leucogenys TaxID=61853 RepID=UPI00122DBD42|nr:uncharacterized protein LOC115830899 [Nomascus leucogenys]
MKGQGILFVFHNRIGSGRIFEKKYVQDVGAWNRTEASQKHVFLVEEGTQERFTAVLCYLLCTPPPYAHGRAHFPPHQTLGNTPKALAVSRLQFLRPGTLCCHLVADLRHSKLAAGILFELGLRRELWFGSNPYRALLPVMLIFKKCFTPYAPLFVFHVGTSFNVPPEATFWVLMYLINVKESVNYLPERRQ